MAAVLVLIFNPYVFARARIYSEEPAVNLRWTYNKIGWEIIKQHPFLGIGIGNQVSYAISNGLYQKYGLEQEWQQQPVHNIYILIAS